jgi:hypothetical protein
MPDRREVHRNGLIRLAAVLTVLLAVGATAGWHHLLGWPALVLATDVLVTSTWLLLHRPSVRRRAVVPGA